jgi:hypothetical protein
VTWTATEEIEVDTSTFTTTAWTFSTSTFTETATYPSQASPGAATAQATRTRTNTSFSSSSESGTFTDTTASTYTVSGTILAVESARETYSSASDAAISTTGFAVPHISVNSLTTIQGVTTRGGIISFTQTDTDFRVGANAVASALWTGTRSTADGGSSTTTASGRSTTATTSLSVAITSATFETTENLRMSATVTVPTGYSLIVGTQTGQAITYAVEADATKRSILSSAATRLTTCYLAEGAGIVPFTSTSTLATGATSVTHRLATDGGAYSILATLQSVSTTTTTTAWAVGVGGNVFAISANAFSANAAGSFLGRAWGSAAVQFASGDSTAERLWRFTQLSGGGSTTGSSHKSFTALTSSMQRHMETVAHATVSIGPAGVAATASFSPSYPVLWT